MIWSAPAAFWLALTLGVILVLHGIRLFRRRMPTTTLWIWRELAKESHTSLRLERIVRNLPLLLQLLLAALLVLALARPLWFREVAFDKDLVLVVDASASMNTRADGATRFEKARRAALNLVDQLRSGQRMALVRMARAPRLVLPFTDDPARLKAALAALRPTDEHAALKPALLFALSLAKDLGERQVALIGDGAYGDEEGAAGILNDTVTFIPVEGGGENAGIVRFAYRPFLPPQVGGELLLTVRSFARAARQVVARVALDGRAPLEHRIALEPGAQQTLLIPVPQDAQGVVRAELQPEDDLASDDRAYLVIARTETAQVLLVGEAEPPLHAVLQAIPDIEVTYRDSLNGELSDGRLRLFDLMIFNRVAPPELEGGTLAVFGAIAPGGGVRAAGWIDRPRIAGWRPDDPLLRYVDVQRLQLGRALRLIPEPGVLTLVDGVEGPLITRRETNGLRVVTIGFELKDSHWAAEEAFPLFMANLVEWGRDHKAGGQGSGNGSGPRREVAAGESLNWRPAPGQAGLEVTGPGGQRWNFLDTHEPLRFEETERVGIYTFRSGDKAVPFAVNLLDVRESDIARNPAIVGRAAAEGERRGFGQVALEGWPWFVAGGLLLLFLEWLVWSRYS
jgi:hypothetical protein